MGQFRTKEHFQINIAIREVRIYRGMSQYELSKRANLTGRSSIARMEKTKGYYPTIPTIIDICLALEINIVDMFKLAHIITHNERYKPENEIQKISRKFAFDGLLRKYCGPKPTNTLRLHHSFTRSGRQTYSDAVK